MSIDKFNKFNIKLFFNIKIFAFLLKVKNNFFIFIFLTVIWVLISVKSYFTFIRNYVVFLWTLLVNFRYIVFLFIWNVKIPENDRFAHFFSYKTIHYELVFI